ncbi:MAG: tetratricopeptide repeat protein [Pyrinomonadaceae bacterium]
MKKTLGISLIVLVLAFAVFGQKLGKPTQASVPATAAQQKTLQEGIKLHDEKNYAEAITKYRSILAESPDCTQAMYELSLSLQSKGEKLEAVETAYRGSKYISDELPLFYVLIANNLDDLGKPQDAINIYLDGLKALAGDNRFGNYRSSLYFNLGVTYLKQKKYSDARQALKSAVENDFGYASPHYMLSYVYNGTRYKIPALLAAARFISLEYGTDRTTIAANTIVDVLKPAPKDPKTGNINITLDMNAPKDEGNFDMFDLFLGTLTISKDDKDKKKTDNELFVDGMNTVIALLAEDKKIASTFVGKNYLPFMVEMKKNGYVEVFSYMALYLSGKQDAMDWLKGNDAKLGSFIAWAKAYQQPPK